MNGLLFDKRRPHSLSLYCKPLGLRNNGLAWPVVLIKKNVRQKYLLKQGEVYGEPHNDPAEADPGFVSLDFYYFGGSI